VVLEKLAELKDVKTYIKVRKAMLKDAHQNIVENEPEEDRHEQLQIIRGRQRELEKLKQVVSSEGFKEYSQKHWDAVSDSKTGEGENQ
jgi:hypothetical protein